MSRFSGSWFSVGTQPFRGHGATFVSKPNTGTLFFKVLKVCDKFAFAFSSLEAGFLLNFPGRSFTIRRFVPRVQDLLCPDCLRKPSHLQQKTLTHATNVFPGVVRPRKVVRFVLNGCVVAEN